MVASDGTGGRRRAVMFTVDVEPDCPPYLWTHRGMDEGMPRLLDLMAESSVRGTFFTTANVARRSPRIVRRIVEEGHELASHGVTHRAFDRMTHAEATREIAGSVAVLREFGPVTAFRAPYLRFPPEFLPILADHGLTVDCSLARYKRTPRARRPAPVVGAVAAGRDVTRIAASVTSSVLRAPDLLRWPWIGAMGWPLMLFVHPWEFVDLRRTTLRWDCRFRTGDAAVAAVAGVFAHLRARGGELTTVREFLS